MTRRMSAMKPMSSMRSASSSTRISTCAQVDRALLRVIEQATGRRDENVDAAAQGVDLRIDADAAEDDERAQPQILAVALDAFGDLGCELARRHEHERARRLRADAPSPLSRCRIGSVKPAVLPVPVWAPARMSRPARISGMTRDCTGVGSDVADDRRAHE